MHMLKRKLYFNHKDGTNHWQSWQIFNFITCILIVINEKAYRHGKMAGVYDHIWPGLVQLWRLQLTKKVTMFHFYSSLLQAGNDMSDFVSNSWWNSRAKLEGIQKSTTRSGKKHSNEFYVKSLSKFMFLK